MQTRKSSFLESIVNVFSGMLISFTISYMAHVFEPQIQHYIWSGFEWKINAGANILVTIVLTIVSVIRGYCWRRHFNSRLIKEWNHESRM